MKYAPQNTPGPDQLDERQTISLAGLARAFIRRMQRNGLRA